MTKTFARNIICGLMAIALSGMLFVQTAYADVQAEVVLVQSGNNVDVTLNKTATDVSSISLDLNLDVKSNNDDAVAIRFDFSDDVKNGTKFRDYRIVPLADGKLQLTIYAIGGNDLLKDDSLYLGQIVLDLDTSKSEGAQVAITIPETADSFETVRNGYNEETEDVYLEGGSFTAYLGSEQPIPTDPQQNPETVGGLPATGDEGVIIVSVLLILVAGLLAGFGINRWRKSNKVS